MVIGVILHFYAGIYFGLSIGLSLLAVLIILVTPLFSKSQFGTFTFQLTYVLFFFFLGGYISHVHKSNENQYYFAEKGDYYNNYLVKVVEPPQEKERSIKCIVEVLQVNEEPACGKTLLYLEKDLERIAPEYGDLLYLNSHFQQIKSNGNPKEFDYARYLRIHNINEQAYVKTEKWKKVGNEANPFLSFVFDLRKYLSGVLKESGMSEKNAMVANALLLGQKEYLDKDVLRSYSSAGAMHVLAVSGLHVGIIMLILNFIFSPLKKLRRGKTTFLILVVSGIWFYALITGLSPSVMRAAVMFSFIVLGKELQRDTTVYQSILVSAFILILLEPYIIFQVGFQLSYLAVLGIVYLQPKIENLFYVKNKILYKAWQISAVSIAAQIATFPLGLYYFHQFPNFFLLSNLIVIPLAFFILMIGISFLVFHKIPYLSDAIFWLFDGLISMLNWGVEMVEKLPYSIMWGISIEWYEVFLLYITILLGSVAFINRKSKVFLASLVGVVILLSLNLYERKKLENENQICIYNINDELAIDVFYGRQNIFYSSEELLNNEDKMLFHVKHNWFYRTGQEEPSEFRSIDSLEFFKIGESSFGVYEGNEINESSGFPDLQFAILHDIDFIKQEIIELFESKKTTLILASNVSYKVKKFLRSRESLSIYDLKEEGAFEMSF